PRALRSGTPCREVFSSPVASRTSRGARCASPGKNRQPRTRPMTRKTMVGGGGRTADLPLSAWRLRLSKIIKADCGARRVTLGHELKIFNGGGYGLVTAYQLGKSQPQPTSYLPIR